MVIDVLKLRKVYRALAPRDVQNDRGKAGMNLSTNWPSHFANHFQSFALS